MYPGSATSKTIMPRKTAILHFKERDDKKRQGSQIALAPAANITESPSEYRILLAAPGFQREEFSIEIEECIISISAKKEMKMPFTKTDRCEYDYSYWTRAFSLPDDADSLLAHAKYRNGELLIRIPRGNTKDNIAKATLYVY